MTPSDWNAVALLGAVLLAAFIWLQRRKRQKPPRAARRIAVDGTNVLFWRDNTARLDTLARVLRHLQKRGFAPVVFLDASSRHHVGDTSLNEARFAAELGLPEEHIKVCPARTEADGYILAFAQEHKLAVVSNDRFRDRPQGARNVRLVKGRFDGTRLILKGL